MSISRNKQLEFAQQFQIAVSDPENNSAFCDTLKCEQIIDKNENGEYLFYPKILSCISTRHDVGRVLLENAKSDSKTQTYEICWSFHITKEKYRIKCSVEVANKEIGDKKALDSVWKLLSDDQKMSYRIYSGASAQSEGKYDELNSFEPQ